ncbi:hypothetical protein [Dubosiella newyorkensis]|uniref:hypothetical protein n=1 Tax=Dubosiella newyorkensis TaxID=1862672 RepID=UPI003F67A039
MFGRIDDRGNFKASNRNRVSLLWFSVGYLEYPIRFFDVDLSEIKEIEISMEVCSEYPGFNSRHLSDLTFFDQWDRCRFMDESGRFLATGKENTRRLGGR